MQQMMKQSTQKKIAMLVLCCMLFTLLPTMAFAEGEGNIPTSGECGATDNDHVTWEITTSGSAYILSITGNGNMANYYYEGPWCTSYKNQIKEVVIGNGITSIGNNAFRGCNALTDVDISSSVSSIGESAFYGCSQLECIKIPQGVNEIKKSTFQDCSKLNNITIPKSVTSIGEDAFSYCSTLKNIEISENVTSIGKYAFRGCSGLTSITIPDDVVSIEYGAFYSCSTLADIYISSNVTSIGENAFALCGALTSITIPKSVISIGNYAFIACNTLTDVLYEGTEAEWDSIAIGNGNSPLTKNVTFAINTVSFETDGGSEIESVQVKKGDTVAEPQAPIKNGYTFVGWYSDKELTKAYDFTAKVTEKMTLYAKWEKRSSSSVIATYSVKFDTNGGSTVKNQTVTEYQKAKEPTVPTKDGYTFAGWYSDKALTKAYDFTAKVTKSMTLYAKWIADDENDSDNKKDDSSAEIWNNPFSDVSESDWYYNAVKYAQQNKLMGGMTSNTFAPNAPLTRGMLVTILYRMEGNPAVTGTMPFSDVNANAYYYNAILWAVQNNIVSGVSATEFAPDVNITREQIAAILQRYAQYKGYDTTQGGMQIREYSDYDKISGYAMNAMTWAVNSGLLKGKGDNIIAPQDLTTRAEIAAILQRFIEGNK